METSRVCRRAHTCPLLPAVLTSPQSSSESLKGCDSQGLNNPDQPGACERGAPGTCTPSCGNSKDNRRAPPPPPVLSLTPAGRPPKTLNAGISTRNRWRETPGPERPWPDPRQSLPFCSGSEGAHQARLPLRERSGARPPAGACSSTGTPRPNSPS